MVIQLRSDELDRLVEIAERERRDPRAQAALMLSRALGMPPAATEHPEPTAPAPPAERGARTDGDPGP